MTESAGKKKTINRNLIYGLLALVAIVALFSSYTIRTYLSEAARTASPAILDDGSTLKFLAFLTDPKTVIVYFLGYLLWAFDIAIKIAIVVLVINRFPGIKTTVLDPLAVLAGDLAGIAHKTFVKRTSQT